jgi:hypothetical protein
MNTRVLAPTQRNPATLPIQPEPANWIVTFLPGPCGGSTAVTRFWERGDTLRCRLCPVCTALHSRDSCQVHVRGELDEASIPLLSLHGRDVRPTDPPRRGVVGPVKGDAVG